MSAKKAARKNPSKKKAPVKKTGVVCDVPDRKEEFTTIYLMGQAYRVPSDATIMGAIEYAGYQIKRGAGCREGYCGACATV